MLRIEVGKEEFWDEAKEEFVSSEGRVLEFEHSLVSLSKWESRFEKPFLGKDEKTTDETLYYIRCMLLTPDVPEEDLHKLSHEDYIRIGDYINAKSTATWFTERGQRRPQQGVVTAEIIYYWMVSLQIPMEAENWHLNRLITLVRTIDEKNKPGKQKMSKAQIAQRNRELNAARRAQTGSTG